jgi:hypothetical protein
MEGHFHGFLLGAPSPSSGVYLKKTAPLPSRRIAQRKLPCASAPLRENTAVRLGVCVPFAPLASLALIGSTRGQDYRMSFFLLHDKA